MRLGPSIKKALALLLLTPFIAVGRCSQSLHLAPTANSSDGDELKRDSDGTATATGIVIENYLGCQVDAICYLQIRVGNKEVRVIYHPGEGENHINKTAYEQGAKAKKGTHIRAYGQYRKKGSLDIIETFSSNTFYIRILPN